MMNVVIANSEGETMPPEKIHRNQEEKEVIFLSFDSILQPFEFEKDSHDRFKYF